MKMPGYFLVFHFRVGDSHEESVYLQPISQNRPRKGKVRSEIKQFMKRFVLIEKVPDEQASETASFGELIHSRFR